MCAFGAEAVGVSVHMAACALSEQGGGRVTKWLWVFWVSVSLYGISAHYFSV